MSPNRHSSRGGVLRVLVWVLSILLLLGVGAFTLFDWVLRQEYEPQLGMMRKDAADNAGFFCEQQTLLAQDPWFHEPRTEGDASPLLNAWLSWEYGPEMPADSPLTLPAGLVQRAKTWESWLTADLDADLPGLDFSWMAKLHAYDRWDTLKHRPVPLEQPFHYMTANVPNYIPLQLWAKFRLRQGMKTGNIAEAARDVRHLAWLAYRSDTILGAMIAVAILGLEQKAHASMAQPPADWRPMMEEQKERMRAVFWASMTFSSVAAPVEVARKARTCGPAPITRCAALGEAAGMARYLKPFAERPYREAYAALEETLASASCPTSLLKTIWEQGATLEDHPPPGSDLPELPAWVHSLPGTYTGKHISSLLLALTLQDITLLKNLRDGGPAPATAGATP